MRGLRPARARTRVHFSEGRGLTAPANLRSRLPLTHPPLAPQLSTVKAPGSSQAGQNDEFRWRIFTVYCPTL